MSIAESTDSECDSSESPYHIQQKNRIVSPEAARLAALRLGGNTQGERYISQNIINPSQSGMIVSLIAAELGWIVASTPEHHDRINDPSSEELDAIAQRKISKSMQDSLGKLLSTLQKRK